MYNLSKRKRPAGDFRESRFGTVQNLRRRRRRQIHQQLTIIAETLAPDLLSDCANLHFDVSKGSDKLEKQNDEQMLVFVYLFHTDFELTISYFAPGSRLKIYSCRRRRYLQTNRGREQIPEGSRHNAAVAPN